MEFNTKMFMQKILRFGYDNNISREQIAEELGITFTKLKNWIYGLSEPSIYDINKLNIFCDKHNTDFHIISVFNHEDDNYKYNYVVQKINKNNNI